MGIKINVEVPMFLSIFSMMLVGNINTNLMIYRTCYVILGYNRTACAKLGMSSDNATAELEKLVEPTADVISMVKGIVEALVGSILCIFVAPWSDRFGRKPIMVLGTIGGTLGYLIMVAFAYFDSLSPWYSMLCLIPNFLTGGGPAFLTVLMAYISDTTGERQRGFKMGIFEGVMGMGVLLGNSSSAYILKATNYVAMYMIAAACMSLAVLYVVLFIPESLESRETENKLKGFFKFTNIGDMFKTALKKREHQKRTVILLLVLILSLFYMSVSSGSLQFLWLRAKFGWTLVKYNWFDSGGNILWILGTILIVYILHHKLKIEEVTLILIGFVCYSVSHIIYALATEDWHIYLGCLVKLPGAGLSPLSRSFMSKLVQESEIAKLFSVFSVANSLMSLAGSPLFTSFYNYTLDHKLNPGFYNFLTAGIMFVSTLCTLIIFVLRRKYPEVGYTSVSEVEENDSIINSDATEINHNNEEPLVE